MTDPQTTKRHFIEVRFKRDVYRFYGRGQWEWQRLPHMLPQTINGIYILREVLRVVAEELKISGIKKVDLSHI